MKTVEKFKIGIASALAKNNKGLMKDILESAIDSVVDETIEYLTEWKSSKKPPKIEKEPYYVLIKNDYHIATMLISNVDDISELKQWYEFWRPIHDFETIK